MKRTAVSIILMIVCAIAIFYWTNPFYRPLTELSTTSPNKTYRVYMQDSEARGIEHTVHFNVAKNEQPLIENEVFYSDSGEFIHPELKYSWAAENVLRFGFGEFNSSLKPDEISIINQTNKVIRYLKINAGNSYLLLEVQPQTTTRLFDRPQTERSADISWVGVFGQFEDGRSFSNWGVNFSIRGKYTSPAHYCVFIKEGEVIVQSKEFGGYAVDKLGKEVEVPEAKNPSCQ